MNAPQADNPFTAGAAYIDGRYMPIAQAAIPITDWGYRRSDVTYDVVGVWESNFFRLDDHIRRFRSSMRKFRFEPRESDEDIKAISQSLRRSVGIEKRLCGDGLPPRSPRGGHALSSRPCSQLYRSFRHSLGLGDEPPRSKSGEVISSSPRPCAYRPNSVDPTAKNFHWADLARGRLKRLIRNFPRPIF